MKTFLVLMLFSNIAFGAKLEDVKILQAVAGNGSFKLKLQTKDSPSNSYFFLDITMSDPGSFDKLVHVIKKAVRKDSYRLDLDIPSFSTSPSGSYYRSEDIRFNGRSSREPNSVGNFDENKLDF